MTWAIGGFPGVLLILLLGLVVVFEPGRGSEILIAPFKPLFTRLTVVGFLCEPVEIGVGGGTVSFRSFRRVFVRLDVGDHGAAVIRMQGRALHQSRLVRFPDSSVAGAAERACFRVGRGGEFYTADRMAVQDFTNLSVGEFLSEPKKR